MKKFDLGAAKAGASISTRRGESVRILCFDSGATEFPIVATVTASSGYVTVETYTLEGCYIDDGRECGSDLVMATVKRAGWINIYEMGCISGIFKTKETAEKNNGLRRAPLATIKIEWEEWCEGRD